MMSSLHAWEKRSQVTYSIRAFSYRAHSALLQTRYRVHKIARKCKFRCEVMMCAFGTTAHQCTLWLHFCSRPRNQPPSSSSSLPFNRTDVAPESGAHFSIQKANTKLMRTMNMPTLETCQTHKTRLLRCLSTSQINWKLTALGLQS